LQTRLRTTCRLSVRAARSTRSWRNAAHGLPLPPQLQVAPGLRLNFSKSGVSTSIGRRGLWFTIGTRGTRTTVGIPGTGLSYTEQSKLPRPTALDDNQLTMPGTPPSVASGPSSQTSTSSGPMRTFVLLAIIALVAGVFLLARL
jgi:hypothetical protein